VNSSPKPPPEPVECEFYGGGWDGRRALVTPRNFVRVRFFNEVVGCYQTEVYEMRDMVTHYEAHLFDVQDCPVHGPSRKEQA